MRIPLILVCITFVSATEQDILEKQVEIDNHEHFVKAAELLLESANNEDQRIGATNDLAEKKNDLIALIREGLSLVQQELTLTQEHLDSAKLKRSLTLAKDKERLAIIESVRSTLAINLRAFDVFEMGRVASGPPISDEIWLNSLTEVMDHKQNTQGMYENLVKELESCIKQVQSIYPNARMASIFQSLDRAISLVDPQTKEAIVDHDKMFRDAEKDIRLNKLRRTRLEEKLRALDQIV
jgi:hypothetical protein